MCPVTLKTDNSSIWNQKDYDTFSTPYAKKGVQETIGYDKYQQLMVLLVTIMVVDTFLIFSIYSDLLYAIANPLMSGVLGLFLGVFLSGTLCSTGNQNNESNGLLPLRVFLLGIVAGFLLAWDDFLLLSDDIRQPWFWSAVIVRM